MIKTTILQEGLDRIRDLLDADITHAQAGTGTQIPAQTDSGLFNEVTSTKKVVTKTKTTSPATIAFTHVITTSEGNDNDLTEWELRLNSETESFNRTVTAHISKKANQQITRLVVVEFTQD